MPEPRTPESQLAEALNEPFEIPTADQIPDLIAERQHEHAFMKKAEERIKKLSKQIMFAFGAAGLNKYDTGEYAASIVYPKDRAVTDIERFKLELMSRGVPVATIVAAYEVSTTTTSVDPFLQVRPRGGK